MSLTFKGGIVLDECKNTEKCKIVKMPAPAIVSLPMSQHIGAPCIPLVKAGDLVKRGQLIGENQKGLSCNVHSSVSGRVKAIEQRQTAQGKVENFVVIENDFKEEIDESIKPFSKSLLNTESEEIIEVIKNAGVAGMGGAAFPTHAKVQSAVGKARVLIVNCAECEPYITANHRLLLENATEVINGIKILLAAIKIKKAVFAIEDNKQDVIAKLMKLLKGSETFSVAVLKTKYPQGDERQLVYSLTGKEIPRGKLPADIGYVIFNAETCYAVYRAFSEGMPLIERVVTVDGDCIANPQNLRVALGTSFLNVINYCGGFLKKPDKIISGGPMMGTSQWDINTPVIKGTTSILALSTERVDYNKSFCIHCGRCISACPTHLMPCYISLYGQVDDIDTCEKLNALSCIECGCCSYVCPAKVPLIQNIKAAKEQIRAKAAKLK